MQTEFTPYASLAGGVLIGLAAVVLMAMNGRIAGLTKIFGGLLPPLASDWRWRAVFLLGAIMPPILLQTLGHPLQFGTTVNDGWLIAGGLLVGVGVSYSGGCPSGHGVCGIARFSNRSIAATCIFMATAFVTVYLVRHVVGVSAP